jgi:hypothetical protein
VLIALVIAGIVALASLGVSLRLAARVHTLERRLAEGNRVTQLPAPAPASTQVPPQSPLQGLRVALAVAQDAPHPVFATLLKEQFLKADVAEVVSVPYAKGLRLDPEVAELLVLGQVCCNGYAEIYFEADFTCYTAREAVCTVVERPPGGDRPGNLAIELVSRLSAKLEDLIARDERRRAVRELRLG